MMIQPFCNPEPSHNSKQANKNQRTMDDSTVHRPAPRLDPPRVVLPLGDPAGIGAEVTLKALARPRPPGAEITLVGCRHWLEQSYSQLKCQGAGPLADPADLKLVHIPLCPSVRIGHSDAAAGEASFQWLTRATELVLEGEADALVTAPIAKASWHQAGHDYPGQTERLAELCGVPPASMLFTALSPMGGWRLNTLLATTHIPLAQVSDQLTPALVKAQLDRLLAFCRRFTDRPHLVVAGLNPHAGEAGRLGREEADWLIDCLAEWSQEHPEVQLDGPLPPDTCWLAAADAWRGGGPAADGYLALYHDQGLIPVKLLAFDAAVNTTLGLPFLRTSPDHGTAFAIAGQGIARADSMVAALQAAWQLG